MIQSHWDDNTHQPEKAQDTREYTGGNVNYYVVEIKNPKRFSPYTAEAEDIIEALGMNFAEGCAFKAIWRRCAARTLGKSKAGYKGGTYDAEKVVYYGQRMVAQDLRMAEENTKQSQRKSIPQYPTGVVERN